MLNPVNILKSPKCYGEAAVIAQLAEQELLSRLDWITLKPKVIVDVGCGLGKSSAALRLRYPEANLLAMDASFEMLTEANIQTPLSNYICAHAALLPLPDQSVDMIFANLLLPWCASMVDMLKEWQRILRPDGLLMLSVLGVDTLKEYPLLRSLPDFPTRVDMHEVGDTLVEAGLIEPVVDVNHHIVSYREQARCLWELEASGMGCMHEVDRAQLLPASSGQWEVTYEIIYAHAFAKQAPSSFQDEMGTIHVPLSALRQQLRAQTQQGLERK